MQHKFMRLYINGEWTGNTDRAIRVNGVTHDLDTYAKEHGIELPDAKKAKKQINTTKDIQEEEYADMEQSHNSGDTEES